MDIKISIDIIKYTLWFFWALCLFGLLVIMFILIFWDILFPDYDGMPGSVFNGEENNERQKSEAS